MLLAHLSSGDHVIVPEQIYGGTRKILHAGLSSALRHAMGVSAELVRVAVGLEDPEDLIEDFRQAIGGPGLAERGEQAGTLRLDFVRNGDDQD